MATFHFAQRAQQDLENILDYTLEQWGKRQAVRYLEALNESVQLLANNPKLGMPRENLAPGLLSFPYKSHIIYYCKAKRDIIVVRVLHASMDSVRHFN